VSASGYSGLPHADVDYLNSHSTFEHGMPIIEDGSHASSDSFNIEYDNMAVHNNPSYAAFDINEFLYHDDTSRQVPEIRTADTYVEKTLGLQSPLGASSFGCDVGSNAVSV